MTSLTALTFATISGPCAHLTIFRHGEWDTYAPRVCLFYLSISSISVFGHYAQHKLESDDVYWKAAWYTLVLLACHVVSLLTSIVIYRLYFHRLRAFPGPLTSKASHAASIFRALKQWHMYDELQRLHNTYGDYVRIGPNTLSIADPVAIREIHGPQSSCFKGPMYDIALPRHTLHFLRDKQRHALRKRDWRRAFNNEAFDSYEPRIREYTNRLMQAFENAAGKPINAAKWFNLFSFDTMGELGFGRSFDRMEAGEMDYYMKSLHRNTLMIGAFFQTPWIMHILKNIPIFNMQYTSFIAYSKRLAEQRMSKVSEKLTIFSPILDAYNAKVVKTDQDRHDLYGDADLIVIAGSDTIAATLTSACFLLTQHPDQIDKCRQLIRLSEECQDVGKQREYTLRANNHIDAIILETLRLHPVIASGLQRVTPPEGILINKTYIPGGVRVQTPSYVMFRDERYFVRPNDFIPERHTTQRELIIDSTAFIPFHTGVYSCLGKQLAMKECQYVIREMIQRFDFSLAPGQTTKKFHRSKRDTFTLFIKDLNVLFRLRDTL